jgi:hypothetical protein
MVEKGRGRGRRRGQGSGGGSGSSEKTGLVDSKMEYGAANNESCSMEEGQTSDVDNRATVMR